MIGRRGLAWATGTMILGLGLAVFGVSRSTAGEPDPDTVTAQVTVYGAKWCGACKQLEQALRDKSIPFDEIDVDDNPGAYAWAKKATGQNVIPLTSIARKTDLKWVVGANVSAVEKAYRGED